jgi:hypothetical protein
MNADLTSNNAPAPTGLARLWTWARERGPATLVAVLVNLLLPFLIYRTTHRALGDVYALMAASAPPITRSIFEFARHRRVDALSLIVLGGIALSLIAYAGGGGVRFLQLREHLVAAVIGLVFLGSAAIGKPLIHQLARARLRRQGASAHLDTIERLRDSPLFRRAMMTMTLAWGIGLVAESALSCALIFVTTIQQFMLVSAVIGYSTIGGLTAWTFWYARRRVLAAIAAPEQAMTAEN